MPLHPLAPKTGALNPFDGTPQSKRALEVIGPMIEPLLRSCGLSPQFEKALPIPGLYAIMSNAGGGKSVLCRELDAAVHKACEKAGPDIGYLYSLAGEPEDPYNTFEYVFSALMDILTDNVKDVNAAPSIIIIDSFSDLAYQEMARAPRATKEEITKAMAEEGRGSITGGKALPTILDLALEAPNIYFSPNTAALAGGLTGSYFQILKKLSMLATSAGCYLFVVLNPLSFDDRGAFRTAVSGVVAGALSIDKQSSGLARCVLPDADGNYSWNLKARKVITNDRIAVTSNDVTDLFSQILGGHDA